MKPAVSAILSCLLCLVAAQPSTAAPSVTEMPVNTWVEVAESEKPVKWKSSIWYAPTTDEFVCWGKGPLQVYDVLSFKVGQEKWSEAFPLGKEKEWSNQRFPNWPTHGHWSWMKDWKGPSVEAADHCVAGFMQTNRVSFVETEGLLRPTRCPTFHQGCWDSKRDRLVYFVGGKTFSYDPAKRLWTNLEPETSPAWCQYLVWASLCYDGQNDEIVLFGGGMAMNPWGGARTWIYDCQENTWRRPTFGTPELSGLRGEVERVAGQLRNARCRLQYEEGQDAGTRRAAVEKAVAELKPIGAELKALASRPGKEKQAEAQVILDQAAAPAPDGLYERVWELKSVEERVASARRHLLAEPPLRCNTQMVYDPKNKVILLFGGDAQNAELCDTWVYDVQTRQWEERRPEVSPPPSNVVTATYAEKHGLVVAAGLPAGDRERTAWAYDAAKNVWTPLAGTYAAGPGWHTIAYSPKDDLLVLVTEGTKSWGGSRTTYFYRLDPATAGAEREGFADSTTPRWHFDWDAKTRPPPPPDPEEQAKKLAELPANEWIQWPGPHVPRKGWGSATIDTDKSTILYIGGGHSTYSGTDTAHYDIGAGRWSLSYPPEFPPFLRGTSRTVYGWSYHLHPWAEHTRKWYAYDPQTKMVVYIRQGSIRSGDRMQLAAGEDGVVEATGYATWIYDPQLRKWYPPSCNRPFGTGDSDRLIATADGIYANTGREGVWHCTLKKTGEGLDARYIAEWKQVAEKGPGVGHEFDATVYDSKRHRLVQLSGARRESRPSTPQMKFFDLTTYETQPAKPEGQWDHHREACYIPGQDVVFTPVGHESGGYYVYRCNENRWVQVDIASPSITYIHRGEKRTKAFVDANPDTVILYDPRHKVLFRYGVGNTVHLMRYDDKTVQVKR